jgi:hypothetical protein
VAAPLRRVRKRSPPICSAERSKRLWSAESWGRMPGVPRIVAYRNHGALIPSCVQRVTRHGLESCDPSGTFCGMRVVPRTSHTGGAAEAAPRCVARAAARRAARAWAPACSTPRRERRTVCRTRTPSRWNMPEALVGVTVRQPCCLARGSRSVTLVLAVVLAMQEMATIVALVVLVVAAPVVALARSGFMCPPVRMV